MKMPKKILLFVCDYKNDGTPIFAVATKLADISEDCNKDKIGEYKLVAESRLTVTRELKPSR